MPFLDLRVGDSREVLQTLQDDSVDAVVTDPPYALESIAKRFGGANAAPAKSDVHARISRGFMGEAWDTGETAFDPEFWGEVWRVLKPGGWVIAASATRNYHKLATAIENAGRWDKLPGQWPAWLHLGFEVRDLFGWVYSQGMPKRKGFLKPAIEPWVMARKPISERTLKENVSRWGVGLLFTDECRVALAEGDDIWSKNPHTFGGYGHAGAAIYGDSAGSMYTPDELGRWPANIGHDGSDDVVAAFPNSGTPNSAARFFYCAKASQQEREAGLWAMLDGDRANIHATVKPVDLMRNLIKLVTPPGGLVLDPFLGSGSTGVACVHEDMGFIGVDLDERYVAIAEARIAHAVDPKMEPKASARGKAVDPSQMDFFS